MTSVKLWFKLSGKAFYLFLIGLAVTALLMYFTYKQLRREIVQELELESMELQVKLEARFNIHNQILRSGVALFAVSDTVTLQQWKDFYEYSHISRRLPGLLGFGYAHFIPGDQLQQHLFQLRTNGFSQYSVSPAEPQREYYSSIIYLEPFTGRNLRAFGYDMLTEQRRAQAMLQAVDSNHTVLSRKITLVQETHENVQPGFLMYAPVYKQGKPITTVDERRAAIKGWVYSPFRMHDFIDGIFEQWQMDAHPNIRFRIYDSASITPDNLLYDSHADHKNRDSETIFQRILSIRFHTNSWTLVTSNISSNLLLHPDLLLVFLIGFFFSLMLFLLANALAITRANAIQVDSLNQQLAQSNADKDRFITVLSHDLKTPFNSMLGFQDILIKEFDTLGREQSLHFLKIVNEVTRNTFRMLENMLQWVRVQAGKFSFEPAPIEFSHLCDEVCSSIHGMAQSKNITIHKKFDEKIRVYADLGMLRIVMRNLVSNAIKYSHPDGNISIIVTPDKGSTIISVSDHGVGMTPEVLNNLFLISRIASTRGTANEHGTGMGLILCQEFITRHGGRIWAESEQGKGSTFHFTLPVLIPEGIHHNGELMTPGDYSL